MCLREKIELLIRLFQIVSSNAVPNYRIFHHYIVRPVRKPLGCLNSFDSKEKLPVVSTSVKASDKSTLKKDEVKSNSASQS